MHFGKEIPYNIKEALCRETNIGEEGENNNGIRGRRIVYLVFSGSVLTKYGHQVVARSFSAKKS